jgi:hypothetical protein
VLIGCASAHLLTIVLFSVSDLLASAGWEWMKYGLLVRAMSCF